MAKYSIPDLTSEELSLLGSGAYTEEEILRRRERTAQRRAAREQEAKAYTPPPVEEAPLQEKPPSNLWGKTADVVGGAASELWPGIKSGYRGLLGGMAQGLADDPSQVIPSMMPPGTAALNRLFGGQSLEEKAADSIGLSDYLASSSRQLNESNAALNAAETKDIPQIPSGELGNVFDENPEGVGKYYGRQLGHSLGFMGPAIAAGVASRGKLVAPMVTMGLMTKASDYGEFRGKGASEEQASLASTGTGVLEGVLGAIPIGIATKPGTGLFKRAIGAALGEEITEIPTTIGQMATEEAVGITNYNTEDYIQGIRDTALIAGIPGAAGAVVAHPFSKKPASKDPAPFIAGQEMSNELERLVKEAKSKTPDMSKDIDMANSFVSLNLDDITKMPQFTMDLKGHKFQDNNMVQPIPTEVQATPQNRVDELQRQAKEEQLRNLGMPRLPDSVWEGGRQIEPVMPGPFQTQNAEPALQPDPLTGQAPAIPEMTFNNEFRPPSQLQGREVLGLKNYSEKTGVGTGPIGPANAPTEAPVQPEGMPEVPSQYQQSYTLPPFKQGYDLKLGKQTKQAETKASPAAEIKSLLDQLNRKPKLASSADTDMAILERQEDTDRFEQVIRKGNIQDAHTLADTLKGMLKSDRAKSMVNAFLSAGFLKNVQVRIADTEADLAMLETDNARALYQPAKDGAPAFILLAPSKAGPTRHGMSPDLVYHEIGHAVTYEMVEAARTGVETTPEIQSLYEQLDMLRQDVAANIDKMATNEAERQAIQNATSDVHEMISYTLTNQNFNKAASRFRVKGITVRQWIKNILSKLATKFGVSVKDANNMMDVLFDRALTAVQETAKYDPAKFEMRGKVDKETGTVDKRLVNKDTGKPLASEITTNPPVLYSQLEKLVNSKMSPKNATWRKWQEWLKSMQENGHLKQEELDAFYAYGDDHLYVPSDQIVSRDEVIEMVNRFDKRAFRMMQRGDTTIEDAPIDISEVKQRPMRDATKERLDDLLARHDLIDEVPDAENLIPEDEREAVAAYLKEKFPDMESHQETFRVLSDAAGLYYMDEEAAITSLKNLINKFDEYLRNFLPNFKGRGDLSVENMYLELENKAKGIISGTLPEYNARGRVALEEEVGNLQDLIGEGKGIMHEIATAKKARHRAEKEAYDFREQYSQEFLANEILVELGLIETGAFEEYTDTAYFESHTLPGGKDYGILGLTENNPNKNYRHPHFAEKNLIGWTRYKTRGNALALEEIQSDWNQWYNSPDRGRIKKKLEELADVKKELNELKEARRNYEAGNQPAAVHTLILLNYIPEGHRDAKLPHLGASILSFIKHTEANIEAIENALYVLKAENVRVQSDPANKPAISKDWSTTMFKLAIAEAVAKGLDYVAYTKGRVQAERWPVKDSNIPKMYDVTMKNSLNDYLKRYGSQVQDGATAEGWDDPTVSHGTKGTRYMKDDFWVFPITDSMRETVLTTGQPRFVKRDDTGKVVDEVAERRNRLQPDTTEVQEGEEIVLQDEDQPSIEQGKNSKNRLYSNVGMAEDMWNVIGQPTDVPRNPGSARPLGVESEGVKEVSLSKKAANDSAEGPKPAAVKRPEDVAEEASPTDMKERVRRSARRSWRQHQREETSSSRRGFLGMLGLALGGGLGLYNFNKSDKLVLGKAKAISATILNQKVSSEVEQALRSSRDGSLKAALENLAVYGPPEIQAIARTIANLTPASVKVFVDDYSEVNRHGTTRFDGKNVSIDLYTKSPRQGLSIGTVLHEAAHGIVMARYAALSMAVMSANYSRMGTPKAKEQLAALTKLHDEFRAIVSPRKIADKYKEGEKFSQEDVSLFEASNNIDEFFVRALTDPVFQEFLSKHEYKGKSLMQRFADWVRVTLFGQREGTVPSWLDAALMASNDLTTAMKEDAANNAWITEATGLGSQNQILSRSKAVKRPFESLPPDRSPAGWFVNVMRGLFKPTAIEGKTMGKETMVLVEAMNEYKGQQFYRAQQALNVLADSSDQKTMLLALEGDEEALKKLSADDAQAVSTIVNTIDMLQRAGVVHELASLKNPTEKDIAVAKKVVASILGDEKYRHRAYAKDIQKRGISTKWVADLLRNKDKKGSLWQNAKAHLIANELTIPTDFKSMGLPTLERMYAHWTGLNPEGKSKSELISSLEKFRNKSGPEIDAKAEELVKMLLDLTPTPGPGISRLYAGNKQDLTIVTPRSKIDEPIRKLWGEVEDPLAKIVVTVTKLIEFNARHRFLMNLYETGVKDGWIAEADDPKADPNLSVTLEGREFGPLDGMRVTPNVKSILDSVLKLEKDMEFGIQNNVFQGLGEKVGKKAVRFWERGLISPIKALMLTTNPKVWITNLLSGPGVLMANGNFTGAGGLTVIKNAWGLTNITKHKKWNPFTDKVISQGWMDSALFGELTNEQLSDYASAVADSVFTEDTRRNKFRKLSIAAKDKATGSKDVFRNMFALMDMGYKLMNGVNEANRLRAIHPDWSDEKVMAVASDRVKMTNYTRGRAIPVAKWADKKGLQFFATYMSEIGRTLGYNTMIGVSDVIAGSRDGNPKQIAHGMSRVIGVGLATMYYDQLLSFAVSGAGMLMGSALSILGEDDDEDRNEKARDIIGALPEDWRNQLLVPIAVTKDGKLQMQAADRFDFHGQWNSIFRAAAKVANGKEDWQFLANEVQNLFFMHSLVRNMLNPNPGRLQKIAPEAYEKAYKFLTQTLSLSDSTANRIINTAMTADVPVIRTGLLPTINNIGKPASERQDVNWLGFNPIEYDPKLELVRGADKYNGSLSANRNELAKLIANTGMALDKPGLEKFYNSVLDEEISAFSELNAKVKGARAMGYNNSQIASILASQNVRRDYIPYVMHGKFVPRPFGDRYLQSAFIDTQFSDATPERKKALSNRLIQARAYLDQLRMEYMQNDRLN